MGAKIESKTPGQLFRDAELKDGRGDYAGAFRNLLVSARQGNVLSQLSLGNFYAIGRGVRKDLREAARWYKRAYRGGLSAGALNLSVDLRNQGNIRAAIAWLKRAADMNDGDAHLRLARIYLGKRGGAKAAVSYLRKALSLRRSDISDETKDEARNLLKSIESSS